MIGDPILSAGQNTFYRTADLQVDVPLGSITLSRSFSSSPLTYIPLGSSSWGNKLKSVPVPFGRYASDESNTNPKFLWTTNFYSYVAHDIPSTNNPVDVQTIWGNFQSYTDCQITTNGHCATQQQKVSTSDRLLRLDAGYIFIQRDGTRQYYEARFISDAGTGSTGTTRELFFLTRLADVEGRTYAVVEYKSPDGGGMCPEGMAGTSPGAPYIFRIKSAYIDAGIGFTWGVKTIPGSSATECVITQATVLRPDGIGPSVPFTYRNNQSGWLESAAGGLEPELYNYDGGFGRVVDGQYVAFNPASGVGADGTGSTVGEMFDVAGTSGGVTCASNTCCASFSGYKEYKRTVTYNGENFGNGTSTDPGFVREFGHRDIDTSAYSVYHGTPIHRRVDSCGSNTDSCTAGEEIYGWLQSSGTTSGACTNANASAYRNERSNWFIDRNRREADTGVDAGPFSGEYYTRWERRGIERGVGPNVTSGNPLETWGQGFGYTSDLSAQFVNHTYRSSVLEPGGDAGVVYWHARTSNPNPPYLDIITGRVERVYQYGFTKNSSGTTVFRVLGTFYKTQRTCEDAVAPDPLGRTVLIEGPCEVTAVGAASCIDSTFPRTELHYFPTTDLNANAGRLNRAVQFPNGGCAGGLVTRYESYTPEGDPQEMHDANDAGTFYTYDNRRITSRSVPKPGGGNKTWYYGWDNGKLKSIAYPEGNYELFCYRSGTDCDGTWLRNLQWQAKASNATATSWSERIDYEYWPNDSLKRATYTIDNNPTAVRREEWFDQNAEGDPVRQQVGTGTGSFVHRRKFDGAGNLIAVGPAFNYPGGLPEFCSGSDGRCAWLSYDRANRLGQLDVYPTGSSPGIRTCFDSDKHGNITRVSQGCSTSSSCDLNGGLSTCATANSVNDYQYDDFGNVVTATLANTDDGSGSARGVTRYVYDALGSMTEAKFPSGLWQAHTYDKLGRLLGTTSYPYEAFTLTYDDATVAPSACGPLSNTKGRLVSRTDAVWTTYYSYDSEGRIVRESKKAVGQSDCRTSAPYLDTVYTYSWNGNLTSIRYPHGRTVTYTYPSSGASIDRVSSVSITTHDGTGFNGTQTIIDSVSWEPYGGLRSYVTNHVGSSNSSRVEYMLGGVTTEAPGTGSVTACGNSFGSTNDKTGRLRSLRVSNGPGTLGSGNGEIFKRLYTWTADQVARMDTCYLDDNLPITEIASYDKALRLTQVYAPNRPTSGGWQGNQSYTYDSRGNKTNIVVDIYGSNYGLGYAGNWPWGLTHLPDVLLKESSGGLAHDFYVDRDGFTYAISTPNTSETELGSYFYFNRRAAGTYSSVSFTDMTTWRTFFYRYDAFNRRINKTYPTDTTDYFFYDTGHQLLEDRGNSTTVFPGTPYSLEEYIWLDGRPLAIVRSKLNSSLQHFTADGSGTCDRNGQSVNCGTYFVVTDHIGKPVLSLDSNRRITGVGEYEPFGGMNRHEYWWGTGWTYGGGAGDSAIVADQRSHGMTTAFRAHFTRFEAENDHCGGGFKDGIQTSDNTTSAACGSYTGHLGETWTAWCPTVPNGSGYSQYRINWHTDADNCLPGCWFPPCPGGGTPAGFTMRDFEYQRYQGSSGATMYFPPLRFPGQYFDEETHLADNWNRAYFPPAGRYLQPEPFRTFVVAQTPMPSQHTIADVISGYSGPSKGTVDSEDVERGIAFLATAPEGRKVLLTYMPERYLQFLAGHQYAYAANNPLAYSDSTGNSCQSDARSRHTQCQNSCLAGAIACGLSVTAGCVFTGPADPVCAVGGAVAFCAPTVAWCVVSCARNLDKGLAACGAGKK